MGSLPYVDPIRTFPTLAAASAATGLRDGATIQTQGRLAAKDGEGRSYIYRKTGRSLLSIGTIDGVFYANGAGADDYLEAFSSSLMSSEQASDPVDPPEGNSVIWQSDGTGTGDDGDLLAKVTAGGTTVLRKLNQPQAVFATLSDALASDTLVDGDEVRTNGHTTVGIGSNEYIFHASGWSSLTATQQSQVGFFVRIGATDKYLEARDKTVAKPHQWGARCDGVTDDTAAMNAMYNSGVRRIELPGGTIVADWVIAPGASHSGLIIEGNNTTLIAATANRFALTIDATGFGTARTEINNVRFNGVDDTKHGLALATGSAVYANNCWFRNCGIGLVTNNTISSSFNQCYFEGCYVGTLCTSKSTATGLTIGDINGQTVTIPEFAPLTNTHPSEMSFLGCMWNLNTIAFVTDQPANSSTRANDFYFSKGLFQSGTIGVLVLDGSGSGKAEPGLNIVSGWFEANDKDASVDYDGVTYSGADIYVDAPARAMLNNCRLSHCRIKDDGELKIIDGGANSTFDILDSNVGAISATEMHADLVTIPFRTDAVIPLSTSGRAVSFPVLGKSVWKENPFDGADFIRSYTGTSANPPTTFGTNLLSPSTITDGPIGVNECYGVIVPLNNGPRSIISTAHTTVAGELYAETVWLKSYTNPTTFTADAATDTLTAAGHQYYNTMEVNVSSDTALPAGLSPDTSYFIINRTSSTFQLSATVGGAAIDITDAGTGTHTVQQIPSFDVKMTNESTGYWSPTTAFTISNEWQCWCVAGRATSGGNANHFISPANNSGSSRAFLVSGWQTLKFDDVAQYQRFCKEPYFYTTQEKPILLTETGVDPANPPEGNSVIWQSDGTGSGRDGDILAKVTADGNTNQATLFHMEPMFNHGNLASGTAAFDFTDAPFHTVTATGDINISFTAPRPGHYYGVAVQDGVGSHTVSISTTMVGTAPTIRTGAGEKTLLPVFYDGTTWFWIQ